MAPVLNPFFQGGQEISLELYLVLYPDIHGAPPQMSLEIAQEGQVVARMPLQFKSQILDPSREGKASAVYGAPEREFPYLTDIKGSKLTAGNYDATVTIRQGKSLITRNVPFRVLTDAPAVLNRPKPTPLVKRPDEEFAVVIPRPSRPAEESHYSGRGQSRS